MRIPACRTRLTKRDSAGPNLQGQLAAPLTVVAEAVPAAGNDHGVAQQLVADQAQQLVRNGLLLDDDRRLRRGEGGLLLLADRVRVAAGEDVCVSGILKAILPW